MLSPLETISLLSSIEEEVDASSWNYRGVHLWPLMRSTIGSGAFDSTASTDGSREPTKRGRSLVEGWARCLRATSVDRGNSGSRRESVDAVLLGDGVSRVLLDGSYWDRLCGPFMRLFDSLGMRSLLMEPTYNCAVPRREPSMFIQPKIVRAWMLAKVMERATSRHLECAGFERVIELVQEAGINTLPLQERAVREQATQVHLLSRWFGRLLDRTQPRVALLVDWNVPAFAFNLACARRGIPSIEIQHGVMSAEHWAYSGWERIPTEGYQEIPKIFWCWREEDARVVSRWSSATTRHEAVVGGHLWAREWRLGNIGAPAFGAALDQASGFESGGRDILVTLQRGLTSPRDLAPMVDAVSRAPSDWRWWIRCHPLMTIEEVDSALALFPESVRATSEVATSVPLFPLLQRMDVHVTHSSAVVLEAAELGVPSVVTGAGFEGLFRGTTEGSALPVLFAEDGPGLLRRVEGSAELGGIDRGPEPDPTELMRAILARS